MHSKACCVILYVVSIYRGMFFLHFIKHLKAVFAHSHTQLRTHYFRNTFFQAHSATNIYVHSRLFDNSNLSHRLLLMHERVIPATHYVSQNETAKSSLAAPHVSLYFLHKLKQTLYHERRC